MEAITLADYLRAERAIYEAITERARWLPADDLLLTFRKIVEARAGLAAGTAAAGPAAGAAAQATVTVTVKGEDGKEDESFVVHG